MIDTVYQIAYGDPPRLARECMQRVADFAASSGARYELISTLPGWHRRGVPYTLTANIVRMDLAANNDRAMYVDWDAYFVDTPLLTDRPAMETICGSPHHGVIWSGAGRRRLFATIRDQIARHVGDRPYNRGAAWSVVRSFAGAFDLLPCDSIVHHRIGGRWCR
jgi:hypothetical protein